MAYVDSRGRQGREYRDVNVQSHGSCVGPPSKRKERRDLEKINCDAKEIGAPNASSGFPR